MPTKTEEGVFEKVANDPKFRQYLAREDLIEDFLNRIDEIMIQKGITRAELSRGLGCHPSAINLLMERMDKLTVEVMSDIAFHLGLQLELKISNAVGKR